MLFFQRNCGKIIKYDFIRGGGKMTTSEEKVDTSTEYMTEYEKWAVSGVKRAEELIEESKSKTE